MTTGIGEKLSAYLDGESPQAEAAEIARRLETDPALQAELQALRAANDAADQVFAAMLATPVPLSLARAIGDAPSHRGAAALPRRLPVWGALAASLVCLAIGAGGGWLAGQRTADRDWVADVADYHAVYAAQTRHLAEVPASEADHIVTWLSAEVGTPFTIPDLTAQGLSFEGGRLLVATGKPVGQLMYRDVAGQVVALCFTASDKTEDQSPTERPAGAFSAVVWGGPGERWLMIAPKDYPDLPRIAEAARSV